MANNDHKGENENRKMCICGHNLDISRLYSLWDFQRVSLSLASVQVKAKEGLPHSVISGESGGTSDIGIGVVFL